MWKSKFSIKFLAVTLLLTISYSPFATATVSQDDDLYVQLEQNIVPESWNGEVHVDRYFVDEGYDLGLQLLNDKFEKIYPAERNYDTSKIYLQFMNITGITYDIALTIYIDGLPSEFQVGDKRMSVLDFSLPGQSYSIYDVGDFWPDDEIEHSVYFHVIYSDRSMRFYDGIVMPDCMSYGLTSVDDLYATENIEVSNEDVYSTSSFEESVSFGGGTQVFLANPEMKVGGYHIGAAEEINGKAHLRVIGTGQPGIYGISIFRDDVLIESYRYILNVDELFLKVVTVECFAGDNIYAVIVPLDLNTKMASISTVVHINKGDAIQ